MRASIIMANFVQNYFSYEAFSFLNFCQNFEEVLKTFGVSFVKEIAWFQKLVAPQIILLAYTEPSYKFLSCYYTKDVYLTHFVNYIYIYIHLKFFKR